MGERIRVLNESRGTVLAEQARRASSYWARFRGLLLFPELLDGEGLVLEPCASIHMFFMRYPIDVVFASREALVVGLVRAIGPWRMTRFFRGARMAIELPVGVIERTGTEEGDRLSLERVEPACS